MLPPGTKGLNLEDGSDVYFVFIKSKLFDLHSIFLIQSHQVFVLIMLETQRMLSLIIADLPPSNIHSLFDHP